MRRAWHGAGRLGRCRTRLGGNLNVGTVLFVLTIGPIVHVFLPRLTVGRLPL
jgi:uncharacterized membrane protein YczE